MLATIRAFVHAAINPTEDNEQQAVGVQMAAAALLIEVAAADFEQKPEERAAISHAIQQAFALDQDSIEQLISEAEQHHSTATSMYEYTHALNENCAQEQKFEILIQLWRIAFSDGSLDKYEDHRIRRIADLLYLSHSDFIKAKHIAERGFA